MNNKRYSYPLGKYRGFRSSAPGTRDGNQVYFSLYHTCQHRILSDSCFCFLRGGMTPISEGVILYTAAFPSQRWGREGKGKAPKQILLVLCPEPPGLLDCFYAH